jgi:hypothetical protein
VLSEGGTLADGVVLRPGERDRDADDADDDVDGRRRGAVSAGSWYVRADNAIRMDGGGVCTGGEGAVECGLGGPNTRLARLAAGAGGRWWRRRSRDGGAAASIFTLYRRRRVRLYTDGGSGRGGLLKCALTV